MGCICCVAHYGVQTGSEVFPATHTVANETPGSDWLPMPPVLTCYPLALPVIVKALGRLPIPPLLKISLPELLTGLLLLHAPLSQPLPTSISQAFPYLEARCPESSGQPTSPNPKLQDHSDHFMSSCPLQPPFFPLPCFYCSAAHSLPVLHFWNTLIPTGLGALQDCLSSWNPPRDHHVPASRHPGRSSMPLPLKRQLPVDTLQPTTVVNRILLMPLPCQKK